MYLIRRIVFGDPCPTGGGKIYFVFNYLPSLVKRNHLGNFSIIALMKESGWTKGQMVSPSSIFNSSQSFAEEQQ